MAEVAPVVSEEALKTALKNPPTDIVEKAQIIAQISEEILEQSWDKNHLAPRAQLVMSIDLAVSKAIFKDLEENKNPSEQDIIRGMVMRHILEKLRKRPGLDAVGWHTGREAVAQWCKEATETMLKCYDMTEKALAQAFPEG